MNANNLNGYGDDLADTTGLINPPQRRDVHYVPLIDYLGRFLAGMTPRKITVGAIEVLGALAALWLAISIGFAA